MNGTVRVKNRASTESVIIPYKAITEQLGEFFVYVANDSNKVSQKKVSLGKQVGTDIIITEGLVPGEKVVVQGVQNLREGAAISTTPPPPPAAGAAKK